MTEKDPSQEERLSKDGIASSNIAQLCMHSENSADHLLLVKKTVGDLEPFCMMFSYLGWEVPYLLLRAAQEELLLADKITCRTP